MTTTQVLPSTEAWNGALYGRFRFLLGLYLAVHFFHLVPWAAEIFSSQGVLPDARLSPLTRLFPNVLTLLDGPGFVTALVALAGLGLAFGVVDRSLAVFLLYVLACLFGRNPLIANPSLPYVGWVLLAHAALPALPMGVGLWRSADAARGWTFSRPLYAAAWILLAAGYSFSGYTKLVSPSWLDGTAIARVLESPLARPGVLRQALVGLPSGWLETGTYAALGLELFFLPLALLPRLRPWLWLALLAMHLGLMGLVAFADLSFGMVLVHLFVADPAWLRCLQVKPARRTKPAS